MQFVIPACRESFLKNQNDCGQAAMTEINKEYGFTFGRIGKISFSPSLLLLLVLILHFIHFFKEIS
jgi:hypothetical protein